MRAALKYCLLTACGLLLQLLAAGQAAFTWQDPQQTIIIKPEKAGWLIDETGILDFAQVKEATFYPFPRQKLLDPAPNWHLWSQFAIKNEKGQHEEIILQLPKTGFATAFIQLRDTTLQLETGSLVPLSRRSLKSSINGFRFVLPKDGEARIWIRSRSVFSIYNPRTIEYTLTSQDAYEQQSNQHLFWQGIILGIILVMVLYNLLIGMAVKDTSYLYYVLSILGIGSYFAFFYGLGIEYLWPNSPKWDTFCYLIIVPFSGLMRLQFTRTYLHTPKLLPNTNFIMNGLSVISVLLIACGITAYIFQFDLIYPLLGIIGISGTSIHLLMLIAGMIAFYQEKYKPAKFFIWANVLLVIGAILFIGRELGFLQDNFITRYLVQVGFMIQVVVFSLGLASRLNEMRSQLTLQLLEKEKEKKALIEEQKKELLHQVAQQTKDLKEKNVELEQSIALIKESEHKLSQMNEIKNKLFSVISHDLRNPLATMQSFLKLITEHHYKLSEEEKQRLFILAQQSLDNLNILLFNLLQWSRSQMNLLNYKPERIAIRPILENATKVLQLNAHMKGIEVNIESADNYIGYADKEMTEFVVRNLLSNAIKFSHRNNQVQLKAFPQKDNLVIEVKDFGVGMNALKVKKLLEMNTTNTRKGTEKEKGTGLGLLISKEFIEKNKGKLFIHSEAGKGSSFSFTLQKAN